MKIIFVLQTLTKQSDDAISGSGDQQVSIVVEGRAVNGYWFRFQRELELSSTKAEGDYAKTKAEVDFAFHTESFSHHSRRSVCSFYFKTSVSPLPCVFWRGSPVPKHLIQTNGSLQALGIMVNDIFI